MHAVAVEHLLPLLLPGSSTAPARPAARPPRVLDVGSGSGYLTHVLAELLVDGADSSAATAAVVVVGVEHIPALRDMAEANMRKSPGGRALLDRGRVRFVVGDGRKGWSDEGAEMESGDGGHDAGSGGGGWDVIHVGASAARLHEELVQQLRAPGRMFIPVNDDPDDKERGQHIWTVDKDEQGRVTKKRLFGVRYVPLTDGPKK